MKKALYIILVVLLVVISGCKKEGGSNQQEISLNNKENSTADFNGINTKGDDLVKQKVDNNEVKQNILLTYYLESPKSSNIASDDSAVKIIFSSDVVCEPFCKVFFFYCLFIIQVLFNIITFLNLT